MLFTSSGYCSHPKSNWKQWLCKIWGGRGANKAHYGKCASGVWAILWLTFWVASSTMNSRSLLILLSTIAGAWKRSGIPKNKEENVFPKEKSPEIKRAAYINTFCLCLSVVKDWVRKKMLYPQAISALLEEDSIWLQLKEFVPFLFLHRSISNCILTKMWRIKQLLIHHLHWRGLTQCLGLLSR